MDTLFDRRTRDRLNLPELYDFQHESIAALRSGIRRDLDAGPEAELMGRVLSSPTGSGKTIIAQHMIAGAVAKGSRAVFVVDRLSLLDQTSRRFWEAGIRHGLMSGDPRMDYGHSEHVQVAMSQTLARRGWPRADVVFVDEAHVGYEFVKQSINGLGVPFVGLTATPLARGMGEVYKGGIVQVTTTDRLLAEGRLCPYVARPCVEIDMNGAPLVAGEWSSGEVEQRGRKIVGDIVSTWIEETRRHFGGPAKTMLFSASIRHGEDICEAFQKAGIDARQVTAYDDPVDQRNTIEAFRHGGFPIIVNCMLLDRGVDVPDLQCIIIARPYRKSFSALIQMLGRGMRTAPGKEFVLVIDHAGNLIHWWDDIAEFFANGVTELNRDRLLRATRKDEPATDIECKSCGTVLMPRVRVCPVCGAERRRPNDVETVPGKVITISPARATKRDWQGTEEQLWTACCHWCCQWLFQHGDRDRVRRHASACFHELTGKWPPRNWKLSVGEEVPAAIRSQLDKRLRGFKKSQKA